MPELINQCVVCDRTQFTVMKPATHLLNLPEPFRVVKCQICGLMWLNPRPSDEEYQNIYSAAYFSSNASDAFQSLPEWVKQFKQVSDYENLEAKQREIWYAKRLERIQKLLPQGSTLFDVGAATGEFLAVGRDKGWQVAGLELSDYACQRALERYGITLSCTDLEHFDAKGKTFDVVHLSHVFEHFTNPVREIEKLKLLMHSQSLLVIEVPNQFRDTIGSIIRFLKRIRQLPRTLYSIHHPYFYGTKQLQFLLEKNGLEVLSKRTHFAERWQPNVRHQLLKSMELVIDKLWHGGENLEIIVRLRK
jgi:2-polyprenyl-3-methyl-5-hydroxy-6-metoxy-1,4-benzoquinol methylase